MLALLICRGRDDESNRGFAGPLPARILREPSITWTKRSITGRSGLALIDSDKTAVIAVLVSLLIDGSAVLVLVKLVRLTRNWRRHRQQQTAPTPAPVPIS
jgi:hypothetical protein